MKEFQLTFRGAREHIDIFEEKLQTISEIDKIQVDSVSSVSSTLLDRKPLNQLELVDVVIAFTINIVSSAAWDYLRQVVKQYANEEGFQSLSDDESIVDDNSESEGEEK